MQIYPCRPAATWICADLTDLCCPQVRCIRFVVHVHMNTFLTYVLVVYLEVWGVLLLELARRLCTLLTQQSSVLRCFLSPSQSRTYFQYVSCGWDYRPNIVIV